jgi:hypothetical protein
MRAFVPLCLCVFVFSVFFIAFESARHRYKPPLPSDFVLRTTRNSASS